MKECNMKIRYNVMNISSLEEFAKIKGGINNDCKDVYFLRITGTNNTYIKDIENMEQILSERMVKGQGRYKRTDSLPALSSSEEITYYSTCYDKWIESESKLVCIKATENNRELREVLGEACKTVTETFASITPNVNTSIKRNFIVKMFYWFDKVCIDMVEGWNPRISIKISCTNVQKKHEYLFYYLLTLVGIDVVLLQYKTDIDAKIDKMSLSSKVMLGQFGDCNVPKYDVSSYEKQKSKENMEETPTHDSTETKPRICQTDLQRRNRVVTTAIPQQRNELEFEELALFASSVVMIAIHDMKGDVIGTGSGIMVGRNGYILTNNHVASGGRFYSVRIEDDEQIYKTDEVIKYNPVLDLAVIRINRTLNPIPIYKGTKKLVRGQKVVAIGSPLGLFNSVSNGIISGFRKIDNVDMIQFTAPISHGSSGGAVLNMFGELIGISTAGIDSGQNINLAVGYECINDFIRGFA